MQHAIFLKITLILVGVVIVLLGLNIGLGGILTLGWQSPTDFILITKPTVFITQDNHIRFIGGVWFGIGGLFVLGGIKFYSLKPTLISLCSIIAVGGLFRFSEMQALTAAPILSSLLLEILGFPLLAIWIHKTVANSTPLHSHSRYGM